MSDDSVPLAKAVELWRRQNARLANIAAMLAAAAARQSQCAQIVSAAQYEADRRAEAGR